VERDLDLERSYFLLEYFQRLSLDRDLVRDLDFDLNKCILNNKLNKLIKSNGLGSKTHDQIF
jgi:hypothetical protein